MKWIDETDRQLFRYVFAKPPWIVHVIAAGFIVYALLSQNWWYLALAPVVYVVLGAARGQAFFDSCYRQAPQKTDLQAMCARAEAAEADWQAAEQRTAELKALLREAGDYMYAFANNEQYDRSGVKFAEIEQKIRNALAQENNE